VWNKNIDNPTVEGMLQEAMQQEAVPGVRLLMAELGELINTLGGVVEHMAQVDPRMASLEEAVYRRRWKQVSENSSRLVVVQVPPPTAPLLQGAAGAAASAEMPLGSSSQVTGEATLLTPAVTPTMSMPLPSSPSEIGVTPRPMLGQSMEVWSQWLQQLSPWMAPWRPQE